MPDKPEFTPDEWVRVVADDAPTARRFFGAPPDWPVKFLGFAKKGRIYGVRSAGLVICEDKT